jgi:outer membrane lipoprotein-sorting protein
MTVRRVGLHTAFIVLATVNAAVLSAQQLKGYSYEMVMTVRGTNSPIAAQMDSVPRRARVLSAGSLGRMEYEPGYLGGPMMTAGPGSYVLVDGRTIRMVSPSTKTMTVMDLEKLASGLDDMFREMPMSITVSDVNVSTDSLGPAETILGMATERWLVNAAFTLKMDMEGTTQSFTQRHANEYWIARGGPKMFNPLHQGLAIDTIGPSGPFREMMVKMLRANQRLPAGFVAKHAITMRMDSPAAMNTESTVTQEVANLKAITIDSTTFVVPPDYKTVNIADEFRRARDSLKAATPARKP